MGFIPLLILYSTATLIFAIYSKWQFSDDRGESQGKWHPWGAVMRALACITPMVSSIFPIEIRDWVLVSVIQLPLWDVGINIIALKMKALYLGTSAKTDQLSYRKWIFYAVGLILAILFKTLTNLTNQDIISWIQK
jgi:hypothetical protein